MEIKDWKEIKGVDEQENKDIILERKEEM